MTLQKKLLNVGSYRLTGKKLGKGNFAKVEEAVHSVLNIKVAIKILDVTQIKEDYIIRNLHREARIMSQLRHPCIAGLFQTMQTGNLYYLVTELVGGGDLCTFIKAQKYGKLDERNTKVYARQLISALAHMHNLGIVHRDLKMENVMMNSIQTQIKIVDFGLSNIYDPSSPLRTHCGSPEYAAPELFVPGKCYGPEVDLWSLGVILYGMVVGQLPFITIREDSLSTQERRKKLLLQINKGYTASQRKALCMATPDFRSMVARMLIPDALKRITVNDLMFHTWVTEKGKKGIIMNPWRRIDEDLQISIMKDVGSLLQLDWTTVRYAINSEPQGDIAGVYNIFTFKLQSQQLDGGGITKNIPSTQIPQYITPRAQTCTVKKDSSLISSANLKMKKHIERIKSPLMQKVQKTSAETTPRPAPEKRTLTAPEKRPQTAANVVRARKTKEASRTASAQQKPKLKQLIVDADARNRLSENKHVAFQWTYNEPQQSIPPPVEAHYGIFSVPPSNTRPRTTVAAVAPRAAQIQQLQPVSNSISPCSSNPKSLKNEVQVVGTKGIAKVLSAKKKPSVGAVPKESTPIITPKSTRTTVGSAAGDKIKSKSDPAANCRRVPSAPPAAVASRVLRNLKRSRVLPVTGTLSAPKTAVASAPSVPQARNRRTQSKGQPNNVELSPQVQGDAVKRRASTTPSKHVQLQRTILSDPIARSIAGYIANNIPSRMEGLIWKKTLR